MLPAITIQQPPLPPPRHLARLSPSMPMPPGPPLPSVVHIFTSKEVKSQRSQHADDPLFRHFFGDRLDNRPQQRASGLGSGVVVSPEGLHPHQQPRD